MDYSGLPGGTGSWQLVSQGAEARVYRGTLYGQPAIAKHRFSKAYRHPALDDRIRKHNTLAEARALVRARRAGLAVPAVYHLDLAAKRVFMEEIAGAPVKAHLGPTGGDANTRAVLAAQIGASVAALHDASIIHGDLTTSNMLVRSGDSGQVVLIDFGLSAQSELVEDKAVDLYVLTRAIDSTHPEAEGFADTVLDAYRSASSSGQAVLARLEAVKLRGRKRVMIG